MRVTNNTTKSDFLSRINSQQSRLNILNERLMTGKRINRPSDDPSGAEAVLNLRTSQTELKQFERAAGAVSQKLTAGDDALNSYQNVLDSARSNLSKGLSTTTTPTARQILAVELESLRGRILSIANTQNNGEYVFGGTRQNAPPFDPITAAAAATPNSAQYVQIEPGANAIPTGITAETVFAGANSNIFTDLTNAINALRGTGDAAADQATLQTTMTRLAGYAEQTSIARATIGANINITEAAQENLSNSSLSLDERATNIEGADFAQTAIEYADAQKALDATLKVAATGQRSLFDYI